MENDADFIDFIRSDVGLNTDNRPLRLRLNMPDGVHDDILLPHRVNGAEAICEGVDYRIQCVSTDACLPLKAFIAAPAQLQIVTDSGDVRCVCGIVTEASAGQSDGGLATYQLVVRDALAIMERRTNTRIFRNKNELEIVEILMNEWRASNGVLAACFDYEFDPALALQRFPRREFTMQHNESDAAFVRRLLARRGVAWFVRPGRSNSAADVGRDEAAVHTLVMFDDSGHLAQNVAGVVRYHRDDGTEERDAVTAWSAVRSLQAGGAGRYSWDYCNSKSVDFMTTMAIGFADQGRQGNELAASLLDYLIETPHAGANNDDHCSLGRLRVARHDYLSKCFHGEATVRALCVGEWVELDDHPEVDMHPLEERQFVVTAQRVLARNNLPKGLDERIDRLFARSRWACDANAARDAQAGPPYQSFFTCVRRHVQIVPAYDPRVDLPHPQMQSALVVGPAGEEVHCDEQGRIKLRFPGTRIEDHQHAQGAGATGGDSDSAWVRVSSNWAGDGAGSHHQCGSTFLPRVGSEVLVAFLGGDPDKPVVVGQLFNRASPPPGLSEAGDLPGNRYQSGMRSREVRGTRANQLRFDDTSGQIGAQLASEHGASELNLGWLSQPRHDGDGNPRGEGAELRSDKAVALRAGQGILLSAAKAGGSGPQLERDALAGLADAVEAMTEQLSALSATHTVDAAEGEHLKDLVGRLKNWHIGSNTDTGDSTGGQAGGQPIVAASAAAGMVLGSHANLALGAQSRLDLASLGDSQLSAGHSLFLRAARGLNMIAFKLGIKLVAASGAVNIEAHDGDIVITCPKTIRIYAGTAIDLQAPDVKVVAKGVQLDYGAGAITQQSSGAHTIKASCFDQLDAGDGTPIEVKLPTTTVEHDQRVRIDDLHSGDAVPHRRYRIKIEDGTEVEGISDAAGMSEPFKTKLAYASYSVELLDE